MYIFINNNTLTLYYSVQGTMIDLLDIIIKFVIYTNHIE